MTGDGGPGPPFQTAVAEKLTGFFVLAFADPGRGETSASIMSQKIRFKEQP